METNGYWQMYIHFCNVELHDIDTGLYECKHIWDSDYIVMPVDCNIYSFNQIHSTDKCKFSCEFQASKMIQDSTWIEKNEEDTMSAHLESSYKRRLSDKK